MQSAENTENTNHGEREDQPSVLVAGGAGFLGSYLCEALIAQGYRVICIDNLSHGSRSNIERLLQNPNFTFWQEDITSPGFAISPHINPNHVFHLAGVEEASTGKDGPLRALVVNSIGTKNLLDIAVRKRARFLLVSSAEVLRGVVTSTNLSRYFADEQKFGRITFAEAKRFAEALVAEYVNKYDLQAVVVRVKDPYGPRMSLDVSNPLADLVRQSQENKKVQVTGDGLRPLNPTFVTDIIFGVVKAAVKGEKGEVFNLINPDRYTTRSVAEVLKKVTGLEVEFKRSEEMDTTEPLLNLAKQEHKLKWSPKVDLEQGLVQTATYIKGQSKKREPDSPAPKASVPQLVAKRRGGLGISFLAPTLVFLFVILFWFLILPAGSFISWLYYGNTKLENTVASLSNGNLLSAVESSEKALMSYRRSGQANQDLRWLITTASLGSIEEGSQNYLFLAENISASAKDTALAIESINLASQEEVEQPDVLSKIEEANKKIKAARDKLEIAKSLSGQIPDQPIWLSGDFEKRRRDIETLDTVINSIENNLASLNTN